MDQQMRFKTLFFFAVLFAVMVFTRTAIADVFSGRIVSLAPSVTECLFELGVGELVAGVTEHDVFPEEVKKLSSVGGYYDPSLEKIIALSPDLVIGIATFHARLLERLDSLGVETLPLTIHRGLDGVESSLLQIGEQIGRAHV